MIEAIPENEDKQLFLSLSNTSTNDEKEIPIEILRSKTGKVRMVYGERIRISLADLGCTSPNIIPNARCALEQLHGYGKY